MSDSLLSFLLAGLFCLPFAGFLALWGVRSGKAAGWLAIVVTLLGLGLALLLATTLPGAPCTLTVSWASLATASLSFSLRFDTLTAVMLVLVHFIELLVQLYSMSYLRDEPQLSRYFAYLQLFIGAMLGIVIAGNLVVLYAFWELVGLASYLLIGFWYDRPAAAAAAKKAFLMNRIGDMGFLIGIFLTYHLLGTTEISAFQAALPTLAGVCLFMGCVGKSAQFPLLTWLPDAMEGPTPVSALLHAATMVAAGIFLLARVHPLLSPDALWLVTLIGTITTVWGGYSALFQTDIKKVLAFSTISQLGLMVAGMGTGNVGGALFHLLTHAFFKAGLFLAAGAVIHAVHTQDMRQMGGLRKALPLTFWTYTICAAALAGLPFFSGFLSKEAILSGAFTWAGEQQGAAGYLIPVLLLLSSGLTALYMARQWRLIFFGESRQETASAYPIHDADTLMAGPMVLLSILSIAFWFSLNPLSAHSSWFLELFPAPEAAMPVWLAPASVGLVLVGGWLGFRMREPTFATGFWVRLSVEYGFLDQVYEVAVIQPVRRLSLFLYRTDQRLIDRLVNGIGVAFVVTAHVLSWVDQYLVDGLVNGLAGLVGQFGRLTRSVQNGRIQSYIATAVMGLLLIIWWLL